MQNAGEEECQAVINIDDGFYFKHVFLPINLLKDHINLELTPESLYFEFVDELGLSYSKVTFFTDKIKDYKYNFTDDLGNLIPSHSLGFKAEEMITSAKGITKQDGVKISLMKEAHLLKVIPRKQSFKADEAIYDSFVNVLHSQEIAFECAEYNTDYSFKIPVKTFSEFCGVSINKKCYYVDVYGYREGAIFIGKHSDNQMASRFIGGVTPHLPEETTKKIDITTPNATKKTINIIDEGDMLLYIRIPIKIIKAITKFNNFAIKNSYIYFTIESGKPLRISVDIGNFGNYTLLISQKPSNIPIKKKKNKM